MHRITILALTLAACAPAAPPVAETDVGAPSTSGATASARSGGDSSTQAAVLHDDLYPPAASVDARAWVTARGATLPESLGGGGPTGPLRAWELSDRVGVPRAPGLLVEVTDADRTTMASVLRLVGRELRVVWSGPVAAQGLNLTVAVSSDGATLTVHDVAPHACDCALLESGQKAAAGLRRADEASLRKGCDSRGVFSWSGDAYTRDPSISGLGRCPSGAPAGD